MINGSLRVQIDQVHAHTNYIFPVRGGDVDQIHIIAFNPATFCIDCLAALAWWRDCFRVFAIPALVSSHIVFARVSVRVCWLCVLIVFVFIFSHLACFCLWYGDASLFFSTIVLFKTWVSNEVF